MTKEVEKLAYETLYAIQCAEKSAERTGEDYGYLPPPMWIDARDWVMNNLIPTKKAYNYSHSSYGLKHILEKDIHIYMTNSQFKMLMIECGYLPKDPKAKNWIFQISERSPAFKKRG